MTLSAEQAMLRRDFFGRVTAKETVDLAFQVSGQIERFPVAEGETYEEGALLAQLDLEPLERSVAQAEVNLNKSQRDLDRLQELSSANVAEVQVQDTRTQRDLARIALEDAEERLADATLRAPFEALIVRRLAASYSTVSAGTPVVRLSDMSEIRVDIDVPEILFRRAQSTNDVRFLAKLPDTDATYPLVIREFEAETAAVAQTFRVTLAFTETPGAFVLPGASVTVTAEAREGDRTRMQLPETALVYDAEGAPHVMVFEPSSDNPDTGTVRRTPVEIAVGDDGRIGIADGPAPGTEIVRAGAAMLRDGQSVRRFTGIGE
ncbi:efflux RND transporter periplasmic adaptor subunit [Roseivivax lentus]|nr:efflux RND transporter periplasmic adaptor subunit [Roseivivax lentus]